MKTNFRFIRHISCPPFSWRIGVLVSFLLLTSINSSFAQWVVTNQPYGGYVYCFAVSPAAGGAGGTNLFAGTAVYNKGVLRSTDNGTNWTAANTGLQNRGVISLIVSPNVAGGTNLFAGTTDPGGGVFLSTNNGTNWTVVNTGLPVYTYVYCFAVSPNVAGGTNLFAGTYGEGVFLSTNNGTSWTAASTGLTDTDVRSLAVSPNGAGGTNLFAGTDGGGMFLSTNNGTNWTAVNTGLPLITEVTSLAVSPNGAGGTNLFAGTSGGGVFLSTNNGTSWTAANTGLTTTYARALAVSPNGAGGTNLFAGTNNDGVFLSTNNGTSWTEANTGLANRSIMSIAVIDTNLFAGTAGSGIWRRRLSDMITSVPNEGDLPTHFSLHQNYPNPFNPSTVISYQLPAAGHVSLKIFDLLGREVATLVDEFKQAGTYTETLNASNLPSGVYIYSLRANGYVQNQKMTLLK